MYTVSVYSCSNFECNFPSFNSFGLSVPFSWSGVLTWNLQGRMQGGPSPKLVVQQPARNRVRSRTKRVSNRPYVLTQTQDLPLVKTFTLHVLCRVSFRSQKYFSQKLFQPMQSTVFTQNIRIYKEYVQLSLLPGSHFYLSLVDTSQDFIVNF